jgi:hypothetical protein
MKRIFAATIGVAAVCAMTANAQNRTPRSGTARRAQTTTRSATSTNRYTGCIQGSTASGWTLSPINGNAQPYTIVAAPNNSNLDFAANLNKRVEITTSPAPSSATASSPGQAGASNSGAAGASSSNSSAGSAGGAAASNMGDMRSSTDMSSGQTLTVTGLRVVPGSCTPTTTPRPQNSNTTSPATPRGNTPDTRTPGNTPNGNGSNP